MHTCLFRIYYTPQCGLLAVDWSSSYCEIFWPDGFCWEAEVCLVGCCTLQPGLGRECAAKPPVAGGCTLPVTDRYVVVYVPRWLVGWCVCVGLHMELDPAG